MARVDLQRPDVSDPPFARHMIDHWCRRCGTKFESPYARHLYCEPCSESNDLKRKRLAEIQQNGSRRRDAKRDVGARISQANARAIADSPEGPDLQWLVKVRVPFSWSVSKNTIYALRRKGHVALRREARSYRQSLITTLVLALRGQEIVQNKLWIDIYVEKSNHKGDAVNVVDTVCDAVKVATGLDDRWFCIRHLDWSVNKDDPHLFVGIGQEAVKHSQICSYCGQLLALDYFSKNRANKGGRARICRECCAITPRSPA